MILTEIQVSDVADEADSNATKFVWLELTGRCQLECAHCYAESSPRGTHGSMMAQDWIRVLNDAAELNVEMVQFIGGEPTLHPDLPLLVRHARSRGLLVEVFTNLVHVREDVWESFALPGVSLATSYYSSLSGVHDGITGKRASHSRTRANIARAIERGIRLRVGLVDLDKSQNIETA